MCHSNLPEYHKYTVKCHWYSVMVSKLIYILSARRGAVLQELCIISWAHMDYGSRYSFLKLRLVFNVPGQRDLPCLTSPRTGCERCRVQSLSPSGIGHQGLVQHKVVNCCSGGERGCQEQTWTERAGECWMLLACLRCGETANGSMP